MAKAPARKKVKKDVSDGIAHIHASFNNTIIMISCSYHGIFVDVNTTVNHNIHRHIVESSSPSIENNYSHALSSRNCFHWACCKNERGLRLIDGVVRARVCWLIHRRVVAHGGTDGVAGLRI